MRVLTSAGTVEVTAPRVNDKRTDPDTGQRRRFSSAILGFGGALREVFPAIREQRCWFHNIGNVLSAMPKSTILLWLR